MIGRAAGRRLRIGLAAAVAIGGLISLPGGPARAAVGAPARPVNSVSPEAVARTLAHATFRAPPVVDGVSPRTGALAGGMRVTVTGSGFRSLSRVTFGGRAGTRLRVLSGTKLTVVVPRHPAGTVHVRVVGRYGVSRVWGRDRYTYVAGPVVRAVSPASGPEKGGRPVTVTGSGFSKISKVRFGSAPGSKVRVVSGGKLTVIAPPHAAGVVNIRVTGAYGTSPVTRADRYAYLRTAPLGPVTGLKISAATTSTITLNWTNPSAAGFAGVVIRRAVGKTAPATPTSGTAVTRLAAPAKTWTDTRLNAGTTYSYALFAYDKAGGYARAATVTGSTPGCAKAIRPVSGTLTASTTWTPDCTASYVIGGSGLFIPSGLRLTIAAGTVVKIVSSGITVAPGGALIVSGDAADRVVFTSVNDDSVGGDTSGTASPGQYGDAIHLATRAEAGGPVGSGPSVTVDYAVFRDGANAVSDGFTYCCTDSYDGAGSLSVSNSDISEAVYVGGEALAPKFQGDVFHSGVVVGAVFRSPGMMRPVFTGNTFDITSITQAALAAGPDNSAEDAELIESDLTGFPLTGTGANRFVGSVTGDRLYLADSSVPAGGSWTLSSAGGAAPVLDGVTVSGSMTVAAGTVVKVDTSGTAGSGITVDPGGSLAVAGTSAARVVFTSLEDDSAGGDTNGDGTATSGAPGQYGDAIHLATRAEAGGPVGSGPSVTVDYAVFRDGTNAVSDAFTYCCTDAYDRTGTLSVSNSDIAESSYIGGETATDLFNSDSIHDTTDGLTVKSGDVSFRGSFSNVKNAIAACDWNSGCSVDATYTSWNGSADGPFPQGGSPLVCGAVIVSPWTGESGVSSNAFASANCDGSIPTPTQQLSTAGQQFDEDLAGVEVQCNDGFQTFCAEAQQALSCLSAAQGLAEANSPVPLTSEQTAGAFASQANDKLSGYLADSADPVVSDIGKVAGFAGQILDVVGIITSLVSAYNQCDP